MRSSEGQHCAPVPIDASRSRRRWVVRPRTVSTRRLYVARATADLGWRIWNTKTKRWWGEYFKRYPDELLAELNGEKRSARVAERTRQLQIERRPQAKPKRVR